MSRFCDPHTGKTYIIDPTECRWLYSEYWCGSPNAEKIDPHWAGDIGNNCGPQCPYFTPEPNDLDGLSVRR